MIQKMKFLMNKTKQGKNLGRQRKLQKPWTAEEDRLLVRFVEPRNAIWDSGSPDYKNREVRNTCWSEVAYKTNHTVADTKIHWNTIRSRFNLERRKVLKSIESRDETPYCSTFGLYNSLQFLSKVEAKTTRETSTNSAIKFENTDVPKYLCSPSTTLGTSNSMTNQTEVNEDPEYLCSPPTSSCTSSSMNFDGSRDTSYAVPKKRLTHSLDAKQSVNRAALMKEISYFLRSHREEPREKKWKQAFGELIYHELDRYNERDAQNLKKQLILLCVNFKPGEEHRNMVVESSDNTLKNKNPKK